MILVPAPFSGFSCDAAYFDSTDYARRVGPLTGVSNSKAFTLTGWVYSEANGGSQFMFLNLNFLGAIAGKINLSKNSANKLRFVAQQPSLAIMLDLYSVSDLPNAWTWFGISCDMSDTGKRHLYFGDTDELSVITYTNDDIVFDLPDWAIGAAGDGSIPFYGAFAEVMFWPGVYTDLSVEANRRMFISSSGKPVDSSTPFATLGTPAIYFHLNEGETTNNFVANNDGGATGGAFTVTGALTTYASSPSD